MTDTEAMDAIQNAFSELKEKVHGPKTDGELLRHQANYNATIRHILKLTGREG